LLLGLLLAAFVVPPSFAQAPDSPSAEPDRSSSRALPVPRELPAEQKPRPAPAKPPAPPALPPLADCAPPLVHETLPLPQLLLVPHREATTIPTLTLREVEIGRTREMEIGFREEKQVVTEIQVRPRQEDRLMNYMDMKPVTVTDCTGHCHTEYHPCPAVKTVKVTVYDTVPVQREVVIKVPVLKPGRELVVKKMVVFPTATAGIKETFEAVTVPNEVNVLVPACPHPPLPEPPVLHHP
jgi:hypothetical protein